MTRGPIFIVGLSRSGTKLLREILNRHPGIHIPVRESHFIPYVLRTFASAKDPHDAASHRAFVRYLEQTPFYRNMSALGRHSSTATLNQVIDGAGSWPAIIESVFRHYTDAEDKAAIWGDKTPRYLNHMPLLLDAFPEARFLHIHRDPRDRVLSAHRDLGANIYISAQQWVETIARTARLEPDLGSAYKKVSYEGLVTEPSEVVTEICEFLGIDFNPGMLRLARPVERRGNLNHPTRASTDILASNINKYRTEMTGPQLTRVEQIVFPVAAELGYSAETASTVTRPLSRTEHLLYALPHYIGGLRTYTRRWGLASGVRYAVSGWRL